MEEQQQPTGNVVIRGKDLPGAINVLPAGLGDVLKKRESRTFEMENSSTGMSFSTGTKGGGEVQQTFSSSKASKESSSSFSSSISGPGPLQQQQLSSGMSSSSSAMQQQKTTSTSFSSSMASSQQQQQQSFMQGQATQQKKVLQQQPQAQASIKHGEEIKQESLKTTIQSAITDLEQDIDKTVVDSGDKENYLPSPQLVQAIPEIVEVTPPLGSSMMQPPNGHIYEEYKHGPSEFDKKLKWPREFTGRPDSSLEDYVPSNENLIGVPDFSELDGSGKMTEQFSSSSMQQSKEQTLQTTTSSTFNGHVQQESQQQQQQQSFLSSSSSNNPVLEKALAAPANDADYDSNSLKRRNPRQMFTDSAFCHPGFHPSVADQVEMAHQLSSSLFTDGSNMSKGQDMFLKRAKTSGDTSDLEGSIQKPETQLNLKKVMNPEGKLHDWTDLPAEDIPEYGEIQQMATGGFNPEAARQMVENLEACKGKGGELFAKRRKKADKWVVDEGTLKSNPSQLADQFLVQKQDFQQQEYQETRTETNHTQAEVVDSGSSEERQRLQEEFNQQQLSKQQQGFEMRNERSSNASMPHEPGSNEDLPPNFAHCSLKGRPFTPTMDLSIHNTQGIDVWTTKGPRPYGSKSGTLPRTTIIEATKSGELPPQPSKPKQQQQAPPQAAMAVPQVAICPATPAVYETDQQASIVSSSQQKSSSSMMSSSSSVTSVQQGGVRFDENSIDLEEQKRREYEQWFKTQEKEQEALEYDCSVKYDQRTTTSTNVLEAQSVQQSSVVQEVATHTQFAQNKDEVDRAKQAAEEQQKRLEQEKREKEIQQEQQRLEQMKREQELKEQQLREQQQREQELLEHQMREQKQREQEALAQQRREQEQREQQIREQEAREQQLREDQMREQQMLEQQRKEQEMREFQMREQQMREQQMQEQQMQEQQMREQQMREQQMREQQMREQQMREQQMREQQMQQQEFQQQQTSMSRTTTETSSFSQQQSLQQTNLSMQVKSGGIMTGQQGGQQLAEDYTSSLKPTSEGEIIRTQGDLQYSQSSVQQGQMERVQLRSTSGAKDINDTIRQSGVFVGIVGDLNALVADGNEKHSVRDIVKHFSKGKLGDILSQNNMMQSHTHDRNIHQVQNAPPSLSELQDQAKEKQFSYQRKDQVDTSCELRQTAAEEKMKQYERRTSLKDFMLIEGEQGTQSNQLIDPSNILQVDGSVECKKLYNGTRRTASGRELDSQGRLTDTDKWDNHNAIARGWKNVEDNYHPVTFRQIYGVAKQAPTPVPMMRRQSTPMTATTPVASQQPVEEAEGASDL